MFSEAVERMGYKTSRNMFVGRAIGDFGLSRVETEVLYGWNDTYLRNMSRDQRMPGQILKHVVAVGEPAGKPLKQCRLVQVRLTLDDEEDVELLRQGVGERSVGGAGGRRTGEDEPRRTAVSRNHLYKS